MCDTSFNINIRLVWPSPNGWRKFHLQLQAGPARFVQDQQTVYGHFQRQFVRGKTLDRSCCVPEFLRMSVRGPIAKLLATSEPPDLGPGPRNGVLSLTSLTPILDKLFAANKNSPDRQLARALVLLWHDHLQPAHVLAQSIDSSDGAFVHGIMHRREPDYSNAAYWFRHVGRHPAFVELASGVTTLLEGQENSGLEERLLPKGKWDPFGFIDACERAAGQSNEKNQLLRQVQRLETEVLLERFCRVC